MSQPLPASHRPSHRASRQAVAPKRVPAAGLFAVAALLIGILTGCGGSGSATQTTVGADGSAATDSGSNDSGADGSGAAESGDDDKGSGADDGRPQSFEDLPRTSPLQEFLGRDFTDGEAMQENFAAMEIEAEQKTALCMQELGFEYVPRTDSSMMMFNGPGSSEEPWFSDAWVDKYGFGISTMRFPQSMVGPDLIGMPDEGMMFDEPPEDPNQEYIESLSDGARNSYFEALHGSGPNFDPSMSEEEMQEAMMDFRPTGCANTAREEVFNEGGMNDREFYQAFGDELQQMHERLESDPRVVAFRQDVSACVQAQGLSYEADGMQSLYEQFEADLNSIGMDGPMSDPFAGTGLNPDEMTQEELDDFFRSLPPPRLSPSDQAKLAGIQEAEIKLAKAVIGCGGGPLNEQFFLHDIRVEYEQDFLDQNAEALEPFRPNN